MARRALGGLALVFLMCISLAGARYRQLQRHALEREFRANLVAMAELKASQLEAWRRDRLGAGETINTNRIMSGALEIVARREGGPQLASDVEHWMQVMCSKFGYTNAILTDREGKVVMVAGRRIGDESHLKDLVSELARVKKPVLRDFHEDPGGTRLHLGVNIPIYSPRTGAFCAALLVGIDSDSSIVPTLRFQSRPEAAGLTTLVRTDGTSAYALDARSDQPRRLTPSDNTRNDIVHRAARGERGLLAGTDASGAPVSAFAKQVSNSPWVIVVSAYEEQLEEPLRRVTWMIVLILLLIVGAAAAGLFLLWRIHKLHRVQDEYRARLERRALTGHFEYLSRYANDIIMLQDGDGNILEANDRAVETYGYPREKLLTMNARQLRSGSTRDAFDQQWSEVRKRNALLYETEHQRKDGSVFPIEVSVRHIEVDGVAFRQCVGRDITLRKQAEREIESARDELARSEDRYRRLVETSPAGVYIHADATIVYMNPAALAMFGAKTADELVGTPVIERVHPLQRLKTQERIRSVIELGQQVPLIESQYLRMDGSAFDVEVSAGPMLMDNRPCSLVFFVDITARKQAQEAQAKAEEKLAQAQKMESIGRLAGGVAHDFNNHLTVINGYCEMMLGQLPAESPVREAMTQVRNAGERAAALTRQLLAFSRKQVVEPRVLNLNASVTETEKMLRRLIGEDVRIVTHLEKRLHSVVADPGQMTQVLMNLALNARDAMPRGGHITIETANVELDREYCAEHPEVTPGPYVMLVVSDDGVGMTDAVKRHIFEPFFTTKGRGAGTGLGLATVYGIVRQNGGWVWVYSEVDRGTTFKVYLPKAEPVASPSTVAQAQASLAGAGSILLAEDHADVRRLTASILSAYGYSVTQAANGHEALMVAAQKGESFDLLLTDVVMPDMTGRELAERLTSACASLRVLFMSGYTENVIAHQGVLDAGINFISKPFTPEELAAKVRDVLS